MKSLKNWQTSIRAGALDAAFARLYPGAKAATCRRRYLALLAFYRAQFGETDAAALVSAPGRTEIGGNHTDHENGKVLASAVDLDMLALVSPDGREFTATGICPGRILHDPRGSNGFGYDPLFLPDGHDRTFAELESEVKCTFSHRAVAAAAMRETLQSLFVAR